MTLGDAALVLSALAAIPAAGWAWHVYVRRRFAVVAPGRAYRSAEMTPAKLAATVRRLGIRTVIDLRSPGETVEREHAFLSGLGVAHVHVPAGQVPKRAMVDSFLRVLADADRPVLVHCCHGVGRARVFSAIYGIEFEGWTNERAALSIPRTSKRQRRFLREYARRASP